MSALRELVEERKADERDGFDVTPLADAAEAELKELEKKAALAASCEAETFARFERERADAELQNSIVDMQMQPRIDLEALRKVLVEVADARRRWLVSYSRDRDSVASTERDWRFDKALDLLNPFLTQLEGAKGQPQPLHWSNVLPPPDPEADQVVEEMMAKRPKPAGRKLVPKPDAQTCTTCLPGVAYPCPACGKVSKPETQTCPGNNCVSGYVCLPPLYAKTVCATCNGTGKVSKP